MRILCSLQQQNDAQIFYANEVRQNVRYSFSINLVCSLLKLILAPPVLMCDQHTVMV